MNAACFDVSVVRVILKSLRSFSADWSAWRRDEIDEIHEIGRDRVRSLQPEDACAAPSPWAYYVLTMGLLWAYLWANLWANSFSLGFARFALGKGVEQCLIGISFLAHELARAKESGLAHTLAHRLAHSKPIVSP